MSEYHVPVLLKESVDGLDIRQGGVYLDLTFGGGGHSGEILKRLDAEGCLLGFDQDEDALANVPEDDRFIFVNHNFRYLRNFMRYYGYEEADGILADLGVSSHEFDEAGRGFSFRFEAELDMRMNQRSKLTAATVLNTYDAEQLTAIFRNYGEVENARRLVDLIVKARANQEIKTSEAFYQIILPCIPKLKEKKYLATLSKDGDVRTWQEHTKGWGINLVMMGDGFVEMDMGRGGKYEVMMQKAMDSYFSVEPMHSLREYFDVYSVTVVSVSDSIGGGTALGTTFTGGTSIKGDNEKCKQYATKVPLLGNSVRNTPMIVVMNSPRYAGTTYMHSLGYSIAFCPYVDNDDERFAQIIHHEAVGHGFGYLGDEYDDVYDGEIPSNVMAELKEIADRYGWYSNIDFTPDITKVKWNYFISDKRYVNERLGAWEGAYGYRSGVWRPTNISIMLYNVGGFNAPCREAIYRRVMKLAGESYSRDKFLEYDAVNRKSALKRMNAGSVDRNHFIPLASPVIID